MSVELTIETVEETIVLELQDHVPAVLTIDHIPDLRDELDSKVDKVEGYSLVADDEIDKLSTVEQYAQKNTVNSVAGKQGDVLLDKEDVGLSAVDNTADTDKPVSAAVAAALADKVDTEVGLGLSELSFTTADKLSLDQSEQDRHAHNNKPVIDGLSDDSGVLQYKGLPISDQAALDAKVDKVAGKSLVDDTEIAKLATVAQDATKNATDADLRDRATHTGEQAIDTVTGLQGALDSKVDKESGKSLVSDLEVAKLASVQENATANRADSENADKVHSHEIADVVGLTAELALKTDNSDQRLSDAREWTAATVGQTEAEAGVATTRRAWTAERVRQAVKSVTDPLATRVSAVEALTAVSSVTWDMATDTYTGSPKVTLVHKNMRRCVINNQAQVQYYLDEFDSTKKEDGTPADLSGADGQVVVEINPTYVRRSFVGSKMTTELTHAPLPGFKLHEAFSGGVLKHYIGAYQATVWSVAGGENLSGLNSNNNLPRIDLATDYLTSLPDSFAMVGVSRTNFRTLAQNGGYQLYDYWQWELLKTLFIAEFGNWNSQVVLGNGNVLGAYRPSSAVQSDSPHTMNGRSNSLGNNSGSSATNPFVSYRGIENPWGNAWQWADGVNILERQLWVSNDETLYNDNDETGYIKLGVPLPTTNGYIKEWQKIANGFLPAVVDDGAGAATFIGDYLHTATGRRALRVGGGASDGMRAGLCCAYGGGAAVNSDRWVSARLSKKLRAQ